MFEKFTEKAVQIIMIAQERAKQLGQSFVGTEHILLGILEEGSNMVVKSLLGTNVNQVLARQLIEKEKPRSSFPAEGSIPFTPRAKHVIEYAWDEARQLGHNYVNVEHIFLGICREKESTAQKILSNLGVDINQVKETVIKLMGQSLSKPVHKVKQATPTPSLDAFSRDLTQLAREGKLDPVIGREEEIQRVIQILSRRTKNNPVLTGEAGVGKTAIVEGLAQRIIDKKVPPPLLGKRIVSLDLGLLVAGTRFRGEFEERLKKVMEEVKRAGNIIILVDELHTIIGAGSAEGTLDAANMFKPALARGELQCIGATTLDEYRKYIEEDAALERRFQAVFIDEPTVKETVEILKGLRQRYEEFHQVKITDEAIEAAAKLSSRYVSDRFLPDKAIDLIDEAASRVMLAAASANPELSRLNEEVEQLKREKENAVASQEYEKAAELRDREMELRGKIEEATLNKSGEKIDRTVNKDAITKIVSSWTGVPVTQLTEEETKRLLNMESILKQRVIGQEEALKAITRAIKRSRAGLKDPRRPSGSFIFLGPTGVGKTELGKALAEFLFGDEDALIRVDMSEYLEAHTVSRMVGSPPGYVGYDEGGHLTERIRRRPYSVVLFDEIEKANPEVIDVLLQVLEEGQLTDGKGRTVNFRNTVIIMTSNVGTQDIEKESTFGFIANRTDFRANYEKMKEKLKEALKKEFKPEFLNRVDDIIIFRGLTKEDLKIIAGIMIKDIEERLKEQNITVDVSAKVKEHLAGISYDAHHGARPLRRTIQEKIEDAIADELLKGRFSPGDHIQIKLDKDKLIFRAKEKRNKKLSDTKTNSK